MIYTSEVDFYYLTAMLAAILDFSARHHLCYFVTTVSVQTMGNILIYDTLYGEWRGGSGSHYSVLRVTLSLIICATNPFRILFSKNLSLLFPQNLPSKSKD